MATKAELQAQADQEIEDAKPLYKQVNNSRMEFSEADYDQAKTDLGNAKWEEQQFGYIQARQEAYKSIGDQLDQIYKAVDAGLFGDDAKTAEWYTDIKTVKTDNPKPA
jgi:multidrug efflux pump subunit AcrA (membrane-fusion protein)